MGVQFSQVFPPSPTFTLKDVPSQNDKVFLVTGATSGIGFELAKMLYSKHARVYIAGRSAESGTRAMEEIRQAIPHSDGTLEFLFLRLDDLSSIKASVEEFKQKESHLDILWNNAGVSQPPLGSVSKQGIELQLATNCLGPFLFTELLMPLLDAAVAKNKDKSPGAVRVIWASSQVAELSSPPEGIIMSELSNPPKDNVRNYTTSKVGNWFLSSEMARRYGPEHGIVSVAHNPGAANTNLLRNAKWMKFLSRPLLHSAELAAHTELYAGLSPDLTLENNGAYVIPWGRIHDSVPEKMVQAMRVENEGGTGRAREFWEFCNQRTQDYQ